MQRSDFFTGAIRFENKVTTGLHPRQRQSELRPRTLTTVTTDLTRNMADSEAQTVVVPVKVPEPTQHAPPTLAEPASGPVAELHGASHADQDPAALSDIPAGKKPLAAAIFSGLT